MSDRYSIRWFEPLIYLLVTISFLALAIVVGILAIILFTVTLMTRLKTKLGTLIALIIAIALIGASSSYWLYTSQSVTLANDISVSIDSETSFSELSASLQDAGALAHPRLFKFAARLRGIDRRLMVGRYDFDGSVSVESILDRLQAGDVATILVTVPEGLSVAETAGILSRSLGIDSVESETTMIDEIFLLERFALKSLDGYLFPETYRFAVGVTLNSALDIMISSTVDALAQLRARYNSELSDMEILTLASIIEAEATVASERKTISSVYHNRLERGMLLQADPTVRFALNLYHRKLYYKDLDVDSPYNTYRYRGLPPGPINSPGKASIEAAFDPAETNFLYFVADGTGGHEFNIDLAGHNRSRDRLRANGKR